MVAMLSLVLGSTTLSIFGSFIISCNAAIFSSLRGVLYSDCGSNPPPLIRLANVLRLPIFLADSILALVKDSRRSLASHLQNALNCMTWGTCALPKSTGYRRTDGLFRDPRFSLGVDSRLCNTGSPACSGKAVPVNRPEPKRLLDTNGFPSDMNAGLIRDCGICDMDIPLKNGYIFMYGIQRYFSTTQPHQIHRRSHQDHIPKYVGAQVYEVL